MAKVLRPVATFEQVVKQPVQLLDKPEAAAGREGAQKKAKNNASCVHKLGNLTTIKRLAETRDLTIVTALQDVWQT